MEYLLLFGIVLFSIIIHELAHGYSALFLGDETAKDEGRLTINPIPHIDPVGSILLPILTSLSGFIFGYAKPVPYNPYNIKKCAKYADAIIAFAGPLANIALALIFGLLIRVFDLPEVFNLVVFINIFLAFINLIPIPPLDGSKIVSVFLPEKIKDKYRDFNPLVGMICFIAFILIFHKQIFYFISKIVNTIIG